MILAKSESKEEDVVTLKLLTKKSKNSDLLISGNTLFSQAEAVLCNCKKALAFSEEFLDSDGKLPSGTAIEDLYEHVLQQMFLELGAGGDGADDEDAEEDEDDIESSGRPGGWFFPGWFTFVRCGPMASDDLRSDLLRVGEYKKVQGCNAARKAAAVKAKEDRFCGAAAGLEGLGGRGITLEQNLKIGALVSAQLSAAERQKENLLYVLGKEVDSLNKETQMAIEIAKAACPVYDKDDEFWVEVKTLTTQSKEKRKALTDLKEAGLEKRQDTRLDHFLESIMTRHGVTTAGTVGATGNVSDNSVERDAAGSSDDEAANVVLAPVAV